MESNNGRKTSASKRMIIPWRTNPIQASGGKNTEDASRTWAPDDVRGRIDPLSVTWYAACKTSPRCGGPVFDEIATPSASALQGRDYLLLLLVTRPAGLARQGISVLFMNSIASTVTPPHLYTFCCNGASRRMAVPFPRLTSPPRRLRLNCCASFSSRSKRNTREWTGRISG
jgi:hypothetical protein